MEKLINDLKEKLGIENLTAIPYEGDDMFALIDKNVVFCVNGKKTRVAISKKNFDRVAYEHKEAYDEMIDLLTEEIREELEKQ